MQLLTLPMGFLIGKSEEACKWAFKIVQATLRAYQRNAYHAFTVAGDMAFGEVSILISLLRMQ